MNRLVQWLCVCACICLAAGAVVAQEAASDPQRWDRSTLDVAARLPVQDGGRVKPLATLARFMLLDLSGRTTYRDAGGRKLSSLEWLLECWLYPERAETYEVFLVQTTEVLDAIDLPHAGKRKRDRYSYAELQPARDRLFELADAYVRIDAKQRTHVQEQIVNLAHALHRFEMVGHDLDFARRPLPMSDQARVTALLGSAAGEGSGGGDSPQASAGQVTVVRVLERSRDLMRLHEESHADGSGFSEDERQALADLLRRSWTDASRARALALIPPSATREAAPQWLTPADVFGTMISGVPQAADVARVRDLEEMVLRRDQPAEFRAALGRFQDAVQAQAGARGEYRKVGLELTLYGSKLLQRSLVLYLAGFLLAAIGWLATRARWPYRLASVALVAGTATLVAAIVLRCMIRSRPPVSTLYETILFITAVAVATALVIELINRQRIAQALAAFLGVGGLFLAGRYEALEGIDTMPSLVAVLDTNFWLSTHVTTITMGYAAGLLASAFAHVYLVARLLRGRIANSPRLKSLVRMTYGVICFGLIFSVVGTILGGVWANESWGRFWGWDPKENGALMIVLWQLFILHARMGGYIRDMGIAMAAVFGGMIVTFSWWGVNLLGIGLHSYGFTSGVARALLVFYIVEAGVLATGAIVAWRGHTAPRDRTPGTYPSTVPRGVEAP
jgi:ABC-type transport system involved in cytochrome c biogenesis permease subunit